MTVDSHEPQGVAPRQSDALSEFLAEGQAGRFAEIIVYGSSKTRILTPDQGQGAWILFI